MVSQRRICQLRRLTADLAILSKEDYHRCWHQSLTYGFLALRLRAVTYCFYYAFQSANFPCEAC